MKSTIKFLLVICLFGSTTNYTYADGDQEAGGRCGTCMSIELEQDYTVNSQSINELATEAPATAQKITKEEITIDDELLDLLKLWFGSLLG